MLGALQKVDAPGEARMRRRPEHVLVLIFAVIIIFFALRIVGLI
jgi:hypothetical protein